MSFYSDKFSFGNVSNEDMGVVLVDMNSDVLMDYGVKYKETLQMDYSHSNKFYYSQNSEVDTIIITLALVDENGNPDIWTIDKRCNVIDWMCAKEFKPFISGDDTSIIYYFKCVEYTKKFNSKGQGVIEFTMQPESQYAYAPVIDHKYRVYGEEDIIINHVGNVEDKYYPKIEIIQFDKNGSSIEIYNESTGQTEFIINDLFENERLEIDHKLKSVYSSEDIFRLSSINRKWLWLKRGINVLKVKGNCDIRIITQYALKV